MFARIALDTSESPSARRAWVEMGTGAPGTTDTYVALRKEGVG